MPAKTDIVRLAHLHFPGIIKFSRASHIQDNLVRKLLTFKKDNDKYKNEVRELLKNAGYSVSPQGLLQSAPNNPETISPKIQVTSEVNGNGRRAPRAPQPPDPIIFTFSPTGVYTTGRRDYPDPDAAPPSDKLKAEDLPEPLKPVSALLTSNPPLVQWHPTPRGGQTTYHGPGQLVAYTILDLQRLGIGPRQHIRLLEETVIEVLRGYGINGMVTDDPGVWVERPRPTPSSPEGNAGTADIKVGLPRKICAVGVHLRRYVSSYGIGLNVTEEPMFFFRQIAACGLEGREATSIEGEGVPGLSLDAVADRFAESFMNVYNEKFATDTRIKEVYKMPMGSF
ncbi:hypothetical protein VTO42DRAFT_1593 [Malbranchea cinnamomea]